MKNQKCMAVRLLGAAMLFVLTGTVWAQSNVAERGGAAEGGSAEKAIGPRRRGGAMPQGLVTNMIRVAPDRYEIPVGRRQEIKRPDLPELKDDEPLVTVNGDSISWGTVKRYADLIVSNTRLPTGVTAGDFEAKRDEFIMRNVFRLAQSFISKTVLAQEASRHHLRIDADEFTAHQATLIAELRSKNRNEGFFKEATTPGSFLWREITNSLWVAKLRDDVIRPSVVVSDEEILDSIQKIIKENEETVRYNTGLPQKAEDLLKRIRSDEGTFADIAYKDSDCDSSMDYGEMGIVKCSDLLPALVNALTRLKEGEISDAVETPYSFHILKLNKLNYGFLKEGDKGPAPVVSVNFAHIMLEKKEGKPVPDKEEARKEVQDLKVRQKMRELENRLVKAAEIKTPLKLFDTDTPK